MSNRKPIEAYRLEIIRETPNFTTTALGYIRSFFMKPDKKGKWCEKSEVRELETDYKDALEAVDGMITDRDAFHDKNVKLEKKLDRAVLAIDYTLNDMSDPDEAESLLRTALSTIKGETDEV